MDGIVAKRTLKKSYYTSANIGDARYYENEEEKGKTGYKEKLMFKLAIQTVTTIAILVFIFAVKLLNIQIVKKAAFVDDLKTEWNKNYTFKEIKEYSKSFFTTAYIYIRPIVPKEIEESVKLGITKLSGVFKKNKNINSVVHVYNEEVKIYEETNNSESKNQEIEKTLENVGTSVEETPKVITAVSSLSYQDEIVEKIKETKVNFNQPITGKITSDFGAREEIFKGVDSYHTGTDIAANAGTKVVSSISGTVTVATYNEYNGNYVEVTNGKVVTKYLHMSRISVKKGQSIKAGEKIGEVGSTGLSTGPHLHFEVVYDGVKIDPRLVVDL